MSATKQFFSRDYHLKTASVILTQQTHIKCKIQTHHFYIAMIYIYMICFYVTQLKHVESQKLLLAGLIHSDSSNTVSEYIVCNC